MAWRKKPVYEDEEEYEDEYEDENRRDAFQCADIQLAEKGQDRNRLRRGDRQPDADDKAARD